MRPRQHGPLRIVLDQPPHPLGVERGQQRRLDSRAPQALVRTSGNPHERAPVPLGESRRELFQHHPAPDAERPVAHARHPRARRHRRPPRQRAQRADRPPQRVVLGAIANGGAHATRSLPPTAAGSLPARGRRHLGEERPRLARHAVPVVVRLDRAPRAPSHRLPAIGVTQQRTDRSRYGLNVRGRHNHSRLAVADRGAHAAGITGNG